MKRFMKCIVVVLLAVMLSGCYKVSMSLNVNQDGTLGNMEVEMLMSQQMMDDYEMTGDDLKNQVIGDMTEDEVAKLKIETVNKTIDGEAYTGIKVICSDPSQGGLNLSNVITIDEQNNTLTFSLEGDALSEVTGEFDTGDLGVDVPTLKSYGVELNFNIIMPNTIDTCVGGSISATNPKMMCVDLLSFNGQKIEAVCAWKKQQSSGSASMATLVIVAVACVSIVGYFMLRKKKQVSI